MACVALFYKRLITLGGAEVLLAQHYAYLKQSGQQPKVICFEHAALDRIHIDPADLILLEGRGAVSQTAALAACLRRLQARQVFCHSGHIEFGLAALLAGVRYSVFVHQPTTMSFNETDKYALPFFGRYRRFARPDRMLSRITQDYRALSPLRRLYVNLRAALSQMALRRADKLFVLSPYAVREKREIFGLEAHYAAGAITPARLERLAQREDVRPVDQSPMLVSVSRLDENKRIEILIDALALLHKRGVAARLKLGGTGPAAEALRAHAQAQGVGDAVAFLGYVPEAEIPALYAEMDLFVTIDWADFRITTYEVLAENRRVIVSDDTDADPKLLQSGYVFVAHPDAESLAGVIVHALQQPVAWSRDELSRYLHSFTWPAYFRSIDEALAGGERLQHA